MAVEDIVVIYDFISDEECKLLLDHEKYLTDNNLWDTAGNGHDPLKQWANRFFPVQNLGEKEKGFGSEKDIEVRDLCIKIRKRIREQIKKSWNLEKEIYADSLNLIRWPHGQAQPPHSDYENFGGTPHVYNWRDIGVVLYLNDDFEDGQIYFPQLGKNVEIKAKMLAFFPGDIHHAHGVNEIKNGTRYTLNMFYGFSDWHVDGLEQ